MPPVCAQADRRESREKHPGAGELPDARRLAKEQRAHPEPAHDQAPLQAGDGDPEAAFPQRPEVEDVAEDEAGAPAEHEQRDRPPADEPRAVPGGMPGAPSRATMTHATTRTGTSRISEPSAESMDGAAARSMTLTIV